MGDLIASGGNFSNDINLFGTHTINRANLIVGAGGVNKTYDGTELMNNLTLNVTGLVAGDAVNINGQGSYADRNAGTGISYSVGNLALSGADANNYVLPGGSVLTDTDGIITPKAVTIAAPSVTKVYDGNTNVDATAAQLSDWTTALGITGDTVDGITLAFDDKNVGTHKTLTPSSILISDGNGGANYNITLANDTSSTITRLNSVTWIGGVTGDWNDPANWAGGAVPDLANVANVIIPFGVTPTFGTNVAGPVELDSFSGGSLQLDGGTIDVFGLFDADTLTQNGGTLNAGTLQATDFTQTAGTVNVDKTFTVTNSFTQSPTASIDVGGQVDITHTTGVLTINNVSRDAVKLNSTNGGVHVVNLDAVGNLDITAAGDITQDNTGTLSTSGITTLFSAGNVTLGGPNNDFAGPVNVDGKNVTLRDSAGGLQLGDVTTTGSLDAGATGGDITQSSTSQINVATTTTLSTTGAIALGGEQNQFRGTVSLNANTAEIVQSLGDLVLDIVDVVNNLAAQSVEGDLLQTSTGTVSVGNEATFTARREISLLNPGNDFAGNVQVDAPFYGLESKTPFELIRTGAALTEKAVAMQAQTINDTFVRPAADANNGSSPTNTATGTWLVRFSGLVSGFFQRSTATPSSVLVPADVVVQSDDVFIKSQRAR